MTMVKLIRFACDAEGCTVLLATGSDDEKYARLLAGASGWKLGGVRADRCPPHALEANGARS